MKRFILITFLLTSGYVLLGQTKLLVNRRNGTKDSIALNSISTFKFSSSSSTVTPGIETGSSIAVSTTVIDTTGGTILVSLPGSPVDGMRIIVPPHSFSTATRFKISYAPVKSHTMGQYFNPISPMISVTCDGGYSKYGMTVKIPISLPAGHFAMGFFYDPNTGTVEGIPIDSLGTNSITIATRHFGAAGTELKTSSGVSSGIGNGNIVIASISESVLAGQAIINTGFTPGVDDWEFINWGSYISTEGNCAGQAVTAMWYYYEKRLKGAAPLFHQFDLVNDKIIPDKLWEDNPYGYRLASTVQEDFDWKGVGLQDILRSQVPSWSWKAFALSMLVTGEPQSVLITNSHGLGGHALVVYKMDYSLGKLYVADPNFPNNMDIGVNVVSIRTIDFVNGKFNSYFTGLNAGSAGIEMDLICYYAKTAFIDWDQIGKRWAEMDSKTIGNDRFPKYTLKIQNDNDKDLTDGMATNLDSLLVYCKSTECTDYILNTDHFQFYKTFDQSGLLLDKCGSLGLAIVVLKPGSNKIGFYVMGAKEGKVDFYVDYKWITINCYPLRISPDPLMGSPGKECTFTARPEGRVPPLAKYVWTFGDKTAQEIKINDSTVTHTYQEKGTFQVKVELYDNSKNTKLSEAVSMARIATLDPSMVAVTGGTFEMGNAYDVLDEEARPIHTVTLSSFHIERTEITYEKWTEVRNWALGHGYASADIAEGQNGFGFSDPGTSKVNNPVTSVNWYDILKWCNARSEMDGLQPVYYTNWLQNVVYRAGQIINYPHPAVNWSANGYRLPTEAEWEFAARGGTMSGNFKYSGSNTIGDVTWYAGNSGSSPLIELTTHTVGQKTPNELGLYDMSGNALEWVWDKRGPYLSTAQTDPKGAVGGGTIVLRGGGFNMSNPLCESANRHMQYPPTVRTFPGFRCAAD